MNNDPRRVRGRRSMLVGTIMGMVLLLAAILIAAQSVFTLLGNTSWRDENYTQAVAWHTKAMQVSVVDRWKAPFNRGVAYYGQRSWTNASNDFARAAELAPSQQQCLIRLNWAWALEAAADELQRVNDAEGARERWNEARTVLRDADCPDEQTEEQQQSEQEQDQQDDNDQQQEEDQQDSKPDPGSQEGEEHTDSPSGTQADQQQETLARLEYKSFGKPAEGSEEDPKEDPAKQLQERETAASKERQEAEDEKSKDQAPAGSQDPELGEERTW